MPAMRRRKNRTHGVLPQNDLEPVRSVTNPVGAAHGRDAAPEESHAWRAPAG